MAKVYVAGKTHDWRKVQELQELVRAAGHTITHDWTTAVQVHGAEHEVINPTPSQQRGFARDDLAGVRAADLVIAHGHPSLIGTLWELGAAAALRIPTWLVEWERSRPTVFTYLDNVHLVPMRSVPNMLERFSG